MGLGDLFTYMLYGYLTISVGIAWLPQCQLSNPEEYGWIGWWENTTKREPSTEIQGRTPWL